MSVATGPAQSRLQRCLGVVRRWSHLFHSAQLWLEALAVSWACGGLGWVHPPPAPLLEPAGVDTPLKKLHQLVCKCLFACAKAKTGKVYAIRHHNRMSRAATSLLLTVLQLCLLHTSNSSCENMKVGTHAMLPNGAVLMVVNKTKLTSPA